MLYIYLSRGEVAAANEERKMNKTLEIGKDYGFAFGAPKGATMVYNGGNSWTGSYQGKTATVESPMQTAGALEYINRASVSMGRMA